MEADVVVSAIYMREFAPEAVGSIFAMKKSVEPPPVPLLAFLGGSGTENGGMIAVDSSGRAAVSPFSHAPSLQNIIFISGSQVAECATERRRRKKGCRDLCQARRSVLWRYAGGSESRPY